MLTQNQTIKKSEKVTSIDFSSKMIEMTKRRVEEKAEIFKSDLNKLLEFIKY